jgi:high-affinity Fe2+/Pb2+ permease
VPGLKTQVDRIPAIIIAIWVTVILICLALRAPFWITMCASFLIGAGGTWLFARNRRSE